jgi:hypothetical protein
MRCCSAAGSDSHARCWSANSVSPPSLGSSCACSSEPRLGLGLYEMSECQYIARVAQPDGLAVLLDVGDDQNFRVVLELELVQHMDLERPEAAAEIDVLLRA